ncbi:SDR family NAD(P)-dependent oxidoreductase [Steroidobacter agaridevorans]|uniref:SDR family NAD(P)-dependent oxidoreductase n=1 Tax=Steroidobacter agaridevorans TaxID=2695856 RepID=UPI0013207A57|nr:glucose 1-dehydrogenase [Steroidobacter agaridevorans]GFE87733.1 oxidoreductase [Steroidobacter agaridevorans]
MKKLEGKIAIVTGGSRDIGRAVSERLAEEGARVVVNYCNNKTDGEATLAAIMAAGGSAILVKADLTVVADVERLVAESRKAFGEQIDILVNVTGGMIARKTLAEMDLDFFNQVMALNTTSTFLATKAVVPYMPAGSAIVNLASQAGRDGGGPGAAAYSTSKGAVMSFTRAMAKELGPRGIRVNSLCPGMIATSFHDRFTKDAVRENVAASTPLRRQGAALEVAAAAAYLVSEDASFLTGTNLDVNGGLYFS